MLQLNSAGDYVESSNGTVRTPGAQQPGVKQLSSKTYDIFANPPVFNFTTASNNGGGAATVTQYIFNNATMNAAVTTNTSGAASIVNTYGDGFTGKIYDSMIASANGGRGILIQGFTITSTTGSTGAQYSAAFNTLSFLILNATGQGGTFSVPVDVTAAISNAQYQVGILTVKQAFWLNTLNQISVSLPANTTFAFTFFTAAGSL